VEALVEINVRRLRRALGLSLVAVATASDMSKSHLAEAEVGDAEFRVSELARLARVLRVAPWDLLTFREFPSPTPCTHKETPHVPGPLSDWPDFR
jgi:transcriptional regulator with XRE-family HTH domain